MIVITQPQANSLAEFAALTDEAVLVTVYDEHGIGEVVYNFQTGIVLHATIPGRSVIIQTDGTMIG